MKTELTPVITQEKFDKIKTAINSTKGSAGMDVAQSHIIILQKLTDIQNRLDKMEERWITPLIH